MARTLAVDDLTWWVRSVPKLVNSAGLHAVWIYYLLRSETKAMFTGWYVAALVLLFVAASSNVLIHAYAIRQEVDLSLGLYVLCGGMVVLCYGWLSILAGLRAGMRERVKSFGVAKAGVISGMTLLAVWDFVIDIEILKVPSFSILIWGALYVFLWLVHVYEWYIRRSYRRTVIAPEQMIDEIGKEEEA